MVAAPTLAAVRLLVEIVVKSHAVTWPSESVVILKSKSDITVAPESVPVSILSVTAVPPVVCV